ncbi:MULTISPECIES: SDR family NAD(P)-dependent oxidoreductase [unclassified Crossiella]|uniref:SDR family NAD(P)-dependent oxidoreductase n=1 Tax=unclassified Crossiella TaxID=2620835 RepID=UPI001FFFE998|nr:MULTISPECIES: SDR family NAD(P)-dependent oxidoreductase [unclassified Crossiella]MCK2241510.1 SDR family NAD(P)-dependent oxidoreductase [Crossiella sp. S99.2]MCK2255618.1 SDR family NAD(P)-dependent oxidoreductase [Crossiella sp. S99.1]
MRTWTLATMPDQTGRTAVITGATSGLGLAVAQALSARGARVIMAVRNPAKAEALRPQFPSANLAIHKLDTSDLDSVRSFATDLESRGDQVDVLVNNAGIGNQPHAVSAQGHELHLATNHLGHFLLTALLLPNLANGNDPRVVTVASFLYKLGHFDFDNLHLTRGYSSGRAYANSKLANVLFATELDRRLRATNSPVKSMLTHPGIARTPMLSSAPGPIVSRITGSIAGLLGRPVTQAALPINYAATAPEAPAGQMLSPGKTLHKNQVTQEPLRGRGLTPIATTTLWTHSEALTNATYPTPQTP